MYYDNTPPPHLKDQGVTFAPPRDRHHSMVVAYCRGGATLGSTQGDITSHEWRVAVESGMVKLQRMDGGHSETLFPSTGLLHLDLAFDQNNRPMVTYTRKNGSGYYHYDTVTSAYGLVPLPAEVRFPCVFLDFTEQVNAPRSDIIMAHSVNGKLYHRLQRTRYLTAVEIADAPAKSIVWRAGRLKDGRIAYQWR